MKRSLSFKHKKILWAGMVLWIVSAVIRVILSLCGNEMPGQDILMDMIEDMKDPLSIMILFVIMGIIAPILEEFLFRYWIKSRKRVMTISLFAAMGCYIAISSFWWLGSAGFLVCLLIDVAMNNKPHVKNVLLMLATSLLFASAHVTGFSGFDIETALVLTELFGLGLVACWLTYNFGFWYACLLHALNNIFAIFIVIISPTPSLYTPIEVTFNTPLYSATLKPSSVESIDFREINDSTVVVKGNLPVIAFNLVQKFNPDIIEGSYSATEFFKIKLSRKKEPNWECILKFHDTIPYKNAPQIVAELAKHSRLQIDTTYENMYVLGIDDHIKVNNATGKVSGSLVNLAEDIRIAYDCPVVLEKGTNEFYPIKYDNDLLSYPYEISNLPSILSDKLGLFIYKSDVHKIQVICFSDTHR